MLKKLILPFFITATAVTTSANNPETAARITHIEKSIACINEAKKDLAPNGPTWAYVMATKKGIKENFNQQDKTWVPKLKKLAQQLHAFDNNDPIYHEDIAT